MISTKIDSNQISCPNFDELKCFPHDIKIRYICIDENCMKENKYLLCSMKCNKLHESSHITILPSYLSSATINYEINHCINSLANEITKGNVRIESMFDQVEEHIIKIMKDKLQIRKTSLKAHLESNSLSDLEAIRDNFQKEEQQLQADTSNKELQNEYLNLLIRTYRNIELKNEVHCKNLIRLIDIISNEGIIQDRFKKSLPITFDLLKDPFDIENSADQIPEQCLDKKENENESSKKFKISANWFEYNYSLSMHNKQQRFTKNLKLLTIIPDDLKVVPLGNLKNNINDLEKLIVLAEQKDHLNNKESKLITRNNNYIAELNELYEKPHQVVISDFKVYSRDSFIALTKNKFVFIIVEGEQKKLIIYEFAFGSTSPSIRDIKAGHFIQKLMYLDTNYFAVFGDEGLQIYDIITEKCIKFYGKHNSKPCSLIPVSESEFLMVETNGLVRLINIYKKENEDCITLFQLNIVLPLEKAVLINQNLIAGIADEIIYIFSLNDGKLLKTLNKSKSKCIDIITKPDQNLMIGIYENMLIAWGIITLLVLKIIQIKEKIMDSVLYSIKPDMIAILTNYNEIKFFNFALDCVNSVYIPIQSGIASLRSVEDSLIVYEQVEPWRSNRKSTIKSGARFYLLSK